MATKQNKNALIRCEHCGELYSVTYKECPFCDDYDMDMEAGESSSVRRSSGGKRLVTNKKGGGYGSGWTPGRILATVVSLGMIVAAFVIVATVIYPLIDRGNIESPPPSDVVSDSPSPSDASPSPSDIVSPSPSDDPPASPSVEPSPSIPADQTATGFTISQSDFSFSDRYLTPITIEVTFHPAGSTGSITWTSSDPDIASVDSNGKVSPGTKAGTATITATMAGGAAQTCTVRSTVTGGGGTTSSPSPSQTITANFTLSREDFTLSSRGEKYRITISGSTSTATWRSSNTSVATVASDGTVTAVGNGTCTVTATIGSVSQECIVRVKY